MKKLFLLSLLLIIGYVLPAQDTLWVKQQDGHPYLVHRVQSGETLFQLSRKYAVPPAVLSDVNRVSYQDGLPTGSRFRIPIDQYNFIRIESVVKSRPIYYKASEDDDLRSISRMVNVSQSAIQRWNGKNTPGVETGDVLQVGWIAYDKSEVPFAKPDTTKTLPPVVKNDKTPPPVKPSALPKNQAPPEIDTAIAEETAFEQLYEQQVGGVTVNEESGAAVFYPLRTKAVSGVYYALHHTAVRGSILQITNPASGKTIYAKVIGPIPRLKEYHNTIVGLSSNAISALGATDRRMFCKIRYR